MALLIYALTGSGLGGSGVVSAQIAPVLLLAPFAGPLIDRLPRIQVMVGTRRGRPPAARPGGQSRKAKGRSR